MKRRVLLDTEPLVALIRVQDQFHSWATSQFAALEPPLFTCEAVITEACFLIAKLLSRSRSSFATVKSKSGRNWIYFEQGF